MQLERFAIATNHFYHYFIQMNILLGFIGICDLFSICRHWYEMIHPLLNCYSNTETSLHLNMTGVEHVRSVSLSYWSLLHFDIDQFEFFLNLSRIEIKQSHLTTINPSKRNLVLSSVTFLSIT